MAIHDADLAVRLVLHADAAGIDGITAEMIAGTTAEMTDGMIAEIIGKTGDHKE